MLIDLILATAIAYGLAWLLNKKYYKENPASSGKALLMTIGIFIVITILLTAGMHYRNAELGLPTKKIFDLSSIWISILFYFTLNRVKKQKYEILTEKGGSVATFDSKEKAEEYLKNNPNKNYVIK
jgi:cytochrome bd-type quinol oxidase subunit 2